MKKWTVVCGSYSGAEEKAVDRLTAKMREYLEQDIPVFTVDTVSKETLRQSNIVNIGTLSDAPVIKARYPSVANGDEEGYIVEVTADAEGGNTVYIAGNTMQGVYYGTVSFLAQYLPSITERLENINRCGVFKAPFTKTMPPYHCESAPAIKSRAIWTWGHCIFDYKGFFDNMSLLRLNEIVIWNDSMPINAREVVEYAHGLGIRVIFGFAWGWDTDCKSFDINDCFDEDKIKQFALSVMEYYEKYVLPTGSDGIYFQSFTELAQDKIGGVNIAEAVTSWVNGIANEFFKRYPSLEMQFGLHATSVCEHLEHIAKVDKRIRIVWEDCGAFPYSYDNKRISDFKKTEDLTEKITALRGKDEHFGAVIKGMTTLYWDSFKHIEQPFVLGKASQSFVDSVYTERLQSWKSIQAAWMKNAAYARSIVQLIAEKTHGQTDIQLLVEYGAFEKGVFFPVALAAELLWAPSADIPDIIEKVMLDPVVKFVNL